MSEERDADGGLTCTEVLARLSDYLDDELDPVARGAVEDHLRGCDRCLRFGGAIGAMVRGLRGRLDDEVPPGVALRLQARLAEDDPTS
jgi:anti-sigma factor RsiW